MHTLKNRMPLSQVLARSLAVAVIVGSVLLQPLSAADSWSRVKKLKKGTRVYVYLSGEKYREGSFSGADDAVMHVRVANQEVITLDRDLVLQVAVHHGGRHWYTAPLAIAAAVAGGAAGYGIAKRTTCFDTREKCMEAKGIIVGGLAVGSAAVAYELTRAKEGRKVIYDKKR